MPSPVVVLSDLHFGERFCTLAPAAHDATGRPRALAPLLDYLGTFDRISELILLGDVFEIWRFPWQRVYEAAVPFFAAIADLPVDQVSFSFGNHDHPLLFHYDYLERNAARDDGSCDPEFLFQRYIAPLFPEPARSRLNWFYPLATREIGPQRLILHHGHYLQPLPLAPQLAKLTRHRMPCNRWGDTERERAWTYVFNSFRRRKWDREERDRLHLRTERWRRGVAGSAYAKTLIRIGAPLPKPVSWLPDIPARSIACYAEDARQIVEDAGVRFTVEPSRPIDRMLFIFGHIHHSELWLSPDEHGLSLLSLGAWVDEEGATVQGLNTFAAIFDDRVELRQVSTNGVRLLATVGL